jgi:hypothetical protein
MLDCHQNGERKRTYHVPILLGCPNSGCHHAVVCHPDPTLARKMIIVILTPIISHVISRCIQIFGHGLAEDAQEMRLPGLIGDHGHQ